VPEEPAVDRDDDRIDHGDVPGPTILGEVTLAKIYGMFSHIYITQFSF
jgi:hypothetical protein